MKIHERARAYLSRIEAISGQGGHTATYSAALALIKGFGLPEEQALRFLQEWNATHARPPWTEAELRHKLRDAAKANRPSGYLLQEQERHPLAHQKPRPAPRPQPPAPNTEPASKRASWPKFRALNKEQMQTIAALRRLPVEVIHLAHEARLLAWAPVDGELSFILWQDDFAQARRFDGHPLRLRNGHEVKAKNLPGSRGSFLGQAFLGGPGATGGPPRVLLVEGAIGLLEAMAAAWLTNADADGWTVLAATSAQSRFDHDLLEKLRGRRVRILPDNDKAGLNAAGLWAADLHQVAYTVDAFRLPEGLKDIGEAVAAPERHLPFLSQLFTV